MRPASSRSRTLQDRPAVAGRGAAFGDLNNDGYVDAVVSVLGGRPLVLLNPGGTNHWLTLKLVGVQSNRDGAGAKVRIGKQWAYATTSGSYLSASDGRVYFGLGSERGYGGNRLAWREKAESWNTSRRIGS